MTRTALNYLAVVHVTGRIPKGMHRGASFLAVHTNTDLDIESLRWSVKEQTVPLVEGHPLVLSYRKLVEAGYEVDHDRIRGYRPWTISKSGQHPPVRRKGRHHR